MSLDLPPLRATLFGVATTVVGEPISISLAASGVLLGIAIGALGINDVRAVQDVSAKLALFSQRKAITWGGSGLGVGASRDARCHPNERTRKRSKRRETPISRADLKSRPASELQWSPLLTQGYKRSEYAEADAIANPMSTIVPVGRGAKNLHVPRRHRSLPAVRL